METATTFYKAELRSIDVWSEPEGGWHWNASYRLEGGILFAEDAITPRRVLKMLRYAGYLTGYSKGRVTVEEAWPIVEVQMRGTGQPILALIFEEDGIAGR
jgi:hypothetical protein